MSAPEEFRDAVRATAAQVLAPHFQHREGDHPSALWNEEHRLHASINVIDDVLYVDFNTGSAETISVRLQLGDAGCWDRLREYARIAVTKVVLLRMS